MQKENRRFLFTHQYDHRLFKQKIMIISNRTFRNIFLCFGIAILFSACTSKQTTLKEGIWRAELERKDGHSIFFNFKVSDSSGQQVIHVFNADGQLKVDSIVFNGDSVFIQMPFFGSHFNAKIKTDGSLEGTWTKNYGNRFAVMPFKAFPGDSLRLPSYAEAKQNITGSWETSFLREDGSVSKAIGLFQQNENKVTGTFLTPTGDYRYLQGVVSGDTLKLTGFDGCHALLFTALVDSTNTLSDGKMYSINSKVRAWNAVKKEYDSLPAAYAVHNIQPGMVKVNFDLKDFRTGRNVSLQDDAYKNKVVVIQILGSWCPNCMDETQYLTKYYDENHQRGVELVAISFERTADYKESKNAVQSFLDRFALKYPVLYSGIAVSDPQLTEKIFPNLPEKINVFPTTIFIDKAGFVRKIHKGFNGPATGKYFIAFKKEFNAIVDGLLAEK